MNTNDDQIELKKLASQLLFKTHFTRILIVSIILAIVIERLLFDLNNYSIVLQLTIRVIIMYGIYGISYLVYRHIVPKIINENQIDTLLKKELLRRNSKELDEIQKELDLIQKKEN